MASRIAVAAVSLPPIILIVWFGPPWFSALTAAVAAMGAMEVCTMARLGVGKTATLVSISGAVGLVVGAHFMADASPPDTTLLPIVGIAAAVSLAWMAWREQRSGTLSAWGVTAGAALYMGGLLFHAPLLRALDQGREWVLLLLLVTFTADTCALIAGRAFGKRPLAPSISPTKTWEGALGGTAGALGASVAAVYALGLNTSLEMAVLLGVLMGVAGQLGDLAESRLKRLAGAKDSGWLLPGHGGALDRLDSIAFNLVVVYYLVS